MEFALTIKEIIALLAAIAGTGYFVKELNDTDEMEANKSGFGFIKNMIGDTMGMIKYYTAPIVDPLVQNATAFNQKTMAAMATIKGEEGIYTATGQSILYDDGTEKAGAFSVMDKAMALLTVAGTCGLDMTYDRAKELLTTLNIYWDKWVIAGTDKIMTILDEDGKTEYVPNELATDIKNALIDADFFETGRVVNVDNYVANTKLPLVKFSSLAYEYFDEIKEDYGVYSHYFTLFRDLKKYIDLSVYDNDSLTFVRAAVTNTGGPSTNVKITVYLIQLLTDVDEFSAINKPLVEEDFDKLGNVCVKTQDYTNMTFNKSVRLIDTHIVLEYYWDPIDLDPEPFKITSSVKRDVTIPANTSYSVIPDRGYIVNIGEERSTIEGVGIQTGALLPTYEEQMEALLERLGQTKSKVRYKAKAETETETEYIPITRPKVETNIETNTGTQTDSIADLPTDTADEIVEQVKPVIEEIVITQPYIPEPTFPPIGVINVPGLDPIGDTGFVGIYNPSRVQLRQFTGWLWSDDFLDFLSSKMFGSPFDAIISLHAIYCTPDVTGTGNIVCGRRNSGISSNLCGQYATIDCGSIKINRYFGTARDYQSKIEIYLPFIGIQMLDTADVLDRTLNVTYKIDILTGTCIAIIKADGQIICEYDGNCACQIPISGSSYSSILGALTGAGAALAAGIGLASAPALVAGTLAVGAGVTAGMSANKEPIKKSGSFSANAGALGIKKPFLIITRNVPYEAYDRDTFEGLPCNVTRVLGECNGFTKVHEINLNNVNGTSEEIEELKSLMNEGIII